MKRKSKPQKADKMKFFLYRGLLKCDECGFTITADKKIKPSGKSYTYYYCTKKNPNHKCSQNVFTREEKISSQINEAIQKVSLSNDCADWMLAELEKEQKQKVQSSRFFAQKTENEIKTIDGKLERLMNAYLENVVSLSEYLENKNNLVQQKQILKDKKTSFEQKRDNWFEPAIRFVNEAKSAEILAKSRNLEEKKDFLKKLGSNFQILNQKLVLDFKNPFKILAEAEPRLWRGEAENSPCINWRRREDSNLCGVF